MKVKSESEVAQLSRPHGLQPTRLLRPWDFPGKSTGVACHCLPPTLTLPMTYFRGCGKSHEPARLMINPEGTTRELGWEEGSGNEEYSEEYSTKTKQQTKQSWVVTELSPLELGG